MAACRHRWVEVRLVVDGDACDAWDVGFTTLSFFVEWCQKCDKMRGSVSPE